MKNLDRKRARPNLQLYVECYLLRSRLVVLNLPDWDTQLLSGGQDDADDDEDEDVENINQPAKVRQV